VDSLCDLDATGRGIVSKYCGAWHGYFGGAVNVTLLPGRVARRLRAVYAIVMSFGFIVVLMGYVSGWWSSTRAHSGWQPIYLILFAGAVTVAYTTTSGLSGAPIRTPSVRYFLTGTLSCPDHSIAHRRAVHVPVDCTESKHADFFPVIPAGSGLEP